MKIKYYDYKYLLILLFAVIIIGNGCGVFGGIKLYEGASGAHTHGKQREGATSKKKDSNIPVGATVKKSKAHKKWEQEVLFTEAKRDRRLLLAKRVKDEKAAKKREKERKKKEAEMEKEKKKQQDKMDKWKKEEEGRAENREAVGLDF